MYYKLKMKQRVFITVGTTDFDQLMKVLDQAEFLQTLKSCGYEQLTIQFGRGLYNPSNAVNEGKLLGIKVDVYRFKPTLDEDILSADLVISHCGAGSILESVKYKKPLIVVINDSLQDNHQLELGDALTEGNYCIATTPSALISAIKEHTQRRGSSNESYRPFPINNPSYFCAALSDMFDFED